MLERKGWMNFRTLYLNRIFTFIVCAFLISLPQITKAESLKITGPDGQSRQQNRQFGPTTKADTFWSVAQKMRPNNKVSIYQVMAAIYDANPHAFANSNYNSLEVGMILLVPPAEKMLSIPISIARERAEQDDKHWRSNRTRSNKKVTKPKVKAKPIETQIAEVKAEPESPQKIQQLTLLLEKEESRVISLTDELSRTQDELTMAKDDLEALKRRLAELSDKVDVLESTLTETRQLNASLKAENKVLQDTLALEKEEEPTDIWRSLLDSPLTLALIITVPALLIILIIFLVWRRKSSDDEPFSEVTETPAPEPESPEEIQPQDIDLDPVTSDEENVEEFFEEIAVQLEDSEIEDNVEELITPDDAGGLVSAETDMDDLWAEALDEQIDGKEISADVEELLNKLDESEAEPEYQLDEAEASEDNIDELLKSIDIEQTLDTELEENTDLTIENPEEISADFFEEPISLEPDETLDEIASPDADIELDPFLSESTSTENLESLDDIDFQQMEESEEDEETLIELDKKEVTPDVDSSTEIEFESVVTTEEVTSDSLIPADIENVAEDNSNLPTPESISEAIEPAEDILEKPSVSEISMVVPEQDEAVDDLDALMAEFNVEMGEQKQAEHTELPVADVALSQDDEHQIPDDEINISPSIAPSELEDSLETITSIESAEQIEEPPFFDEKPLETELTSEIESSSAMDFSLDEEASPSTEEDTGFSIDDFESEIKDVQPAPVKKEQAPTPTPTDSDAMPSLDFEMDLSDDELFDSFAQVSDEIKHTEALLSGDNSLELDNESESTSFEGDNMTVDEALAALDNEIDTDITAEKISEDDLSSFQKENGYIDIDKLLNESSEEQTETDLYKEVDVDLGDSSEFESLFESNPMVDVDDAENSVNAKLDLARAYIEIDDKDSAKALLEEIQIDGNERQKSEAGQLLETIS